MTESFNKSSKAIDVFSNRSEAFVIRILVVLFYRKCFSEQLKTQIRTRKSPFYNSSFSIRGVSDNYLYLRQYSSSKFPSSPPPLNTELGMNRILTWEGEGDTFNPLDPFPTPLCQIKHKNKKRRRSTFVTLPCLGSKRYNRLDVVLCGPNMGQLVKEKGYGKIRN